ncbi:SusC/RagA family TonB-linked outer membrane protein [Phocaeicola dorei]|uniref:SusC/RagA family TonB-linked outer membrane protein n=1 Tax=Phocaeicola dorei TaxID=357276 RepID=UPI001BDEF166|nr:TonB-dependent receptor [Phocaeicola dorei]MBT1286708.1 TonB-dependent receptor [Phocaeicola dorei]MBT1290360.1 TonB-dependent receptor [Phocaeicola dorei]
MKKCSKPLGYGIRRTPVVLGLSAALCMPAAFSYANVDNGMDRESVLSVMQGKTIKGQILDETGESMIGVSVLVKGTTIGTVTDFDGNYTLEVPSGKNILEISYIGYKTKEITIGNNSLINIKMEPDTQALDEVVVIGYGTVKKRDLTGAVASMKNEDVTVAPTSNVMEALQGKIAGMDIVKSSGQVGEDVSILLRGSRSIYGSNEPLFIIDGIPGSYSQVNPSDIESVDVLKDASSTAIYGSAGANGVVIITTKRGKEGKATVNFDAYYGFSGSPNYKHGMVGDEWVNYQREAYKYKNGDYPSDMSALFGNQDYTDAYNAGKWIDWIDEASGNTATTQKYSLSVSGGSEKTKIFASTSYNREEGLLSNDNLNKYSLRLNIDQEIFSWAKMGFTSNLTYQDRNQGVKNTFTKGLSSFPLGDAYDQNGKINHEYITGQYSPLGDFIEDQYVNNTRSTYLNVSGYLELSPIKDFTFTSRINGTLSDSRQGQYWGDQCNANRPSYAGSPHAAITNKNAWNYTWENILSYNTTIAKDHNIGGSVITSWNKNQNDSSLAAASGQMVDRWSFWRLASGASQHVESDFAQTQKMSFAVRFNYSYKGKYLFTFSNRWDGVSQFSAGHKWDSFPAGAIAWRISDEPFMNVAKNWLNNLKLRVGYGITGNSGGVDAYGTTTQAYVYTGNGLTLNGQNSSFTQYTGTYGSKDLGWEKSYNWNVGLDYGILNNRVDGSIEWFKTTTKGLLFKRTLPITSGLTGWGSPLSIWQNIAETSNQGVEVTINSHNIKTKDFSWNTTLSVTWSKEKIEKLPDGDLISENLFVGHSIKSIYGYKYTGIWGTNTPQDILDAYGVKPGFIQIETLEKDGDGGVHKYSTNDRQVLGHTNPDWIVGLNNTFTYKNFDLSVFAMARYGQTINSDLLGYYTAEQSVTTNQLAGADYWTENNQGAYYPAPGTGSEQSTVISALRVRDGSFIKVKNITLGYTFPVNISRKALMEKCRIYATAYNPFIYVKDKQLKGTDPETNGSDAFPTFRQFVFGVNLTF